RETALVPALEHQLERARAAAKDAEVVVDAADDALNTATQRFNEIDAKVQQLIQALERDEEEWRDCGVDSASDEDVQTAEQGVTDADTRDRELKSKARTIAEEIARLDERR